MSNYSAENIQAVVNGEQIEPTKAANRVHVGTISFSSQNQKYDIFSGRTDVSGIDVEEMEQSIAKEISTLLIETPVSRSEFVSAINKAIEDSGLAPKVVVEEAK